MKKMMMIAVLVFSSGAAYLQEEATGAKTFSIGPSAGFGHTGIRNTTGKDLFKPSGSAGLIFNYSTSEHIGFAGDILWSAEGARYESSGIETDLTLQYIRVPLKFAYFFGQFGDTFRPKLTIGPSMGFLLDAESDVEGFGETNVTSAYERFDIGLNGSAGFNIRLGTNTWLNTDLNYYTGFMKIRANQYNSNVALKVGLAFGL